jgi:hypothetical protein
MPRKDGSLSEKETLLAALEQIRRYASGEEEVGDGENANDALIRIDNICQSVLPSPLEQQASQEYDKAVADGGEGEEPDARRSLSGTWK